METQLRRGPRRRFLHHGIRPACRDPAELIRLGRFVLEGQQASPLAFHIAHLDVFHPGYIWTSTRRARRRTKSPRCRTRFSQNSKTAIRIHAKIKTMPREARRTSWFPTPITLLRMRQSLAKKETKSRCIRSSGPGAFVLSVTSITFRVLISSKTTHSRHT